MKILISIDKIVALKAGKDRHGDIVVHIPAADLTSEERDVLAQFDSGKEVDFDLTDSHVICKAYCGEEKELFYKHIPKFAEPSLTNIKLLLEGIREAITVVENYRKAEEQKKQIEQEKKFQKILEMPIEELVSFSYGKWSAHDPVRVDFDTFGNCGNELVNAKFKLANELAQTRNEAYAESMQKEADAKAEKTAAKVEKMKQWSCSYGSELLRLRIEEGFEWEKLAQKEYSENLRDYLMKAFNLVVSTTPESYDYDETKERNAPTLEEIKLYKNVRNHIGKLDLQAECWWVWRKYSNEFSSESDIGRAELDIQVTCPNGNVEDISLIPAKDENWVHIAQ